MERNQSQKGAIWEIKTRVSGQQFVDYDFTKTNFNSVIIENTSFINCLFDKSNLAGSKVFYESSFERCEFKNINLSNSTFGSHKGLYTDCLFDKCDFRGKEFNFTRFVNSVFNQCKLKKINFNASSFLSCKFAGLLEDVTFNGMYDSGKSEFPTLINVSFEEASFGEFVTFVNCDLSTCIPPKDFSFDELLYNLYSNNPSILSTGSKDKIVLTEAK